MPKRYKEYIQLLIWFVGLLITALAVVWWSGEVKKDSRQDQIANCQTQIKTQIKGHDERINALEKWLEANQDMPEVMAKIEANTCFMSQRMNEIYLELRELRNVK